MLGKSKKPLSRPSSKPSKLPKLSIQQQLDNQEVIERMNRKITFTKNQRYLTKTIQYIDALNQAPTSGNFRVEPKYLLFTDYEEHHTYEGEIKLINSGNYVQRIKIVPLKVKEFVVASVRYPKHDTGDIAPGLSVSIFIRFRPINLHDYEEELNIITGDGVIKVPILAQREKCQGKWPGQINCGHCWVGDTNQQLININNKGGQAMYRIKGAENHQAFSIGYFDVSPALLKIGKNMMNTLKVTFSPQKQGRFEETVIFQSDQGDEDQEVVIKLVGGAYTASITLEQINHQKVKMQSFHNYLYLKDCEPGRVSESKFKIKNHAVVAVDYFWHFDEELGIQITHNWGKIQPAQIFQFITQYKPTSRDPKTVNASLYLFNLPKESISTNAITKRINGIDAIQCLKLEIRTSSTNSPLSITPLHKNLTENLYLNHPQTLSFNVKNNSSTERKYSVKLISHDPDCRLEALQQTEQIIAPESEQKISIKYCITALSEKPQRGYFLVNFDNAQSEVISVEGRAAMPNLRLFSDEVDFGLVRTNTEVRKTFKVLNDGLNDIYFRVHNPHRYFHLDFYDFYEFESEEYFINRLEILTQLGQCRSWMRVPAQSEENIEFRLHTKNSESIDLQVELEVKNGPTYKINVVAEAQLIKPSLSRTSINLKQIYKGNIYHSTKFLSKELSVINQGNLPFSYEIIPPQNEKCTMNLSKLAETVKAQSYNRLDLTIQPIKTGQFQAKYTINYYDNIPTYPEQANDLSNGCEVIPIQRKNLFKTEHLEITSMIKGVEINYFIKDESRARKVRERIEEPVSSVKLSTHSFKSISKSQYLETERTIYPGLQELNFYNCQINKVEQLEILIENDSGLTAEYEVFAENFHTNEKSGPKSTTSHRGLGQEQAAFTSQMGKTFIQARQLDKAQKVHLSNNKGISIMCEPHEGILFKKQTHKIVVTMFNDTSGRFKDNLVISVKDHEVKKFPININIKGTPISLSKNQLGIDFSQETPSLHTGTLVIDNGNFKRNIKVINNGPKEVFMKWFFYPFGEIDPEKDIFSIKFEAAEPGNQNQVETKWLPVKPEIAEHPSYSIQPKQKILKGRQQANFILTTIEPKKEGEFKNLLIGQPYIIQKDSKREMESLAVLLSGQAVSPSLKIDQKHINYLNKFEKYATNEPEQSTKAKNHIKKIKLTNVHKTNLTFTLDIESVNTKTQNFYIVGTDSNSPLTKFQKLPENSLNMSLQKTKAKDIQKQFTLAYDSYVEVWVQMVADPNNIENWPLDNVVRKDGNVKIMYSNGQIQNIKLVGWLYRPWIFIQMPNSLSFSRENFLIDFGVSHVKNYKKMSIYLSNPSKSTAIWNISYIKYNQSGKMKFEKALWTDVDYEDQTIIDEKKCFRLSKDSGELFANSIPIHYIPSTLALPSQDDEYASTHKPEKIDIYFKPEKNVLYKSKFIINVSYGQSYGLIVRGRGTYEEQEQIK